MYVDITGTIVSNLCTFAHWLLFYGKVLPKLDIYSDLVLAWIQLIFPHIYVPPLQRGYKSLSLIRCI